MEKKLVEDLGDRCVYSVIDYTGVERIVDYWFKTGLWRIRGSRAEGVGLTRLEQYFNSDGARGRRVRVTNRGLLESSAQ